MARPGLRAVVFTALVAAVPVVTAPPVAAGDLVAAKAFVQDLYKGYGKDETAPDLQDARFLEPSLLDLWRKAEKGADGEIVEADPLCACQDSEVTDLAVSVEPAGADAAAGAAKATAAFKNFDERQTVRIDLVDTPAGWRIADIHDAPPGVASFRKLLQDAIAAQKHR